MNTINMDSSAMTTDGLIARYSNPVQKSAENSVKVEPVKSPLPTTAAEVLQNIRATEQTLEQTAKEMQRLSEVVGGRKLLFNVNDETNKIIVTVVNPTTNEIIREIPSEDAQRIAAMMRRTNGALFDEII